jgi:hypothetical protein
MSEPRPVSDPALLRGWKHFRRLGPLLSRLRGVGCERDRSGNRELFYDQYLSLVLLYLFNPMVRSLRGIQAAAELRKVQRVVGCGRVSLGSLSEAARVFDAGELRGVIGELALELPELAGARGVMPEGVKGILTLVDGTVLAQLPRLAEAMLKRGGGGRRRKLHVQFEPLRGAVTASELTGWRESEKAAMRRALEPGRVYVMDRGFAHYGLFEEVIDAGSSLVCRLPDNAAWELVRERPLSDAAREAGVTRDLEVMLGSERRRMDRPMRVVEVRCDPHKRHWKSSSARGGPVQGQSLLIATDVMDLEPELVALIYKKRWAVETFFRQLKQLLGCGHLLSHSPNGIAIQVYAALIACTLITLWTGRKPTRRTHEMLCFYFAGVAELDELEAHVARLAPLADAGRVAP